MEHSTATKITVDENHVTNIITPVVMFRDCECRVCSRPMQHHPAEPPATICAGCAAGWLGESTASPEDVIGIKGRNY